MLLKGWKTNTGLIAWAIGGALVSGSEVAPTPDIAVWLRFIGTILITIGGGGAIYGVADKVQKVGK